MGHSLLKAEIRHPERLSSVTELVNQIVDGLDAGNDVTERLNELRCLTGRPRLEEDEFFQLYSVMSEEEKAEQLLMPIVDRVTFSREELIEIVRQIKDVENNSSAQISYFIELWQLNEPSGMGSDLIFWPSDGWLFRRGETLAEFSASAEDIVDEAIRLAKEQMIKK